MIGFLLGLSCECGQTCCEFLCSMAQKTLLPRRCPHLELLQPLWWCGSRPWAPAVGDLTLFFWFALLILLLFIGLWKTWSFDIKKVISSRNLASCPMGAWRKKCASKSTGQEEMACRVLDGNKDYWRHLYGIFELKICGFWSASAEELAMVSKRTGSLKWNPYLPETC